MDTKYHYTECGLDFVYLVSGFSFVDTPTDGGVVIDDIEGLHKAIGLHLVLDRKSLDGRMVRFLRHELILSQSSLSVLLGVEEQTVGRWERGEHDITPSAERLLRVLYLEHVSGNSKITEILRRIAEIEDEMDKHLDMEETGDGWDIAA